MKALILDGSREEEVKGGSVSTILQRKLANRGWEAESIRLCEQRIGNCAGDFFCWVRSPGICNVNDDNRVISAKVVQSDLLILLTPVTFGGYSSALKRMVDHLIPNVLPFFAKIDGEIHHQKRYKVYPKLLVIGWMESEDSQKESLFRRLVKRNAVNLHAPTSVCGVVALDQPEEKLDALLEGWLEDIRAGVSSPSQAASGMGIPRSLAEPPKRAVLLVASPRTRKSSSASLGGYLIDQLAGRGVEAETIQVYTSLNSRERMGHLLEAIDAADLVVLAFPLYVDSLPAPLIAALERISSHRAGKQTHQSLAAIANSGFPEAAHNFTALGICEAFAKEAGFVWAGGLALGGGHGLIHGAPLNELDGRTIPIKKSLEMAAEALAAGYPIPEAAVELMAKPIIPGWLYLLMGAYGWRQEAKKYRAQGGLKNRPYVLAGRGG